MKLLSIPDLVARWPYTRQGVHKLTRNADFPAPVCTVSQGRVKLWELADIEAYEATHQEVHNEHHKMSKVYGYYLCKLRGNQAKESD